MVVGGRLCLFLFHDIRFASQSSPCVVTRLQSNSLAVHHIVGASSRGSATGTPPYARPSKLRVSALRPPGLALPACTTPLVDNTGPTDRPHRPGQHAHMRHHTCVHMARSLFPDPVTTAYTLVAMGCPTPPEEAEHRGATAGSDTECKRCKKVMAAEIYNSAPLDMRHARTKPQAQMLPTRTSPPIKPQHDKKTSRSGAANFAGRRGLCHIAES